MSGWIITEDLRGVPVSDQRVGAVSSRMDASTYLQLADAAAARDLEPLIHRVSRASGVERFLSDPRLRAGGDTSVVGAVMAPAWQGLRHLFMGVRWSARKARNLFRRRAASAAPQSMRPLMTPTAPPNAGKPQPQQQTDCRVRRSPNPPQPADSSTPRVEDPVASAANAGLEVTPERSTTRERLSEWTIYDGTGVALYRGQAVGVDLDARARRAPLNQIPGLPRDARIEWSGHPEWAVTGVQSAAQARSMAFVASAALADGGLSWASVRKAGQDMAAVARSSARTRAPMEEALARLRNRHRGDTVEAAPTIEAALQHIEGLRAKYDHEPGRTAEPATAEPATTAEPVAAEPATATEEQPDHEPTRTQVLVGAATAAVSSAVATAAAAASSSGAAAAPLHERYPGPVPVEDPPSVGLSA